eukprot:m51a1_g3981 hypothetical protein (637) ;mRNA; r:442307-448661
MSVTGGSSLSVDVGAPDDTSPSHSGGCHLVDALPSSVSNATVDSASGRSWRTVLDSRSVTVSCDARPLGAATWGDGGTPFVSAWANVTFRDDGNSSDCADSYGAACRDGVDFRVVASPAAWVSSPLYGDRGGMQWTTDMIPLPASPFQILRADESGFIVLRITNRGQRARKAGLPVDRVTITFVEEETFTKQLEQERASRGLIRVGWSGSEQDPGITPSRPTPTSPFVLFGGRSYLEKVYSNSTPQARDRFAGSGLVLEVEEVAGEVEPVSVCLYAFDEVVSVSASGSISTPGVATVTVREVVEQDRRWVYAGTIYNGDTNYCDRADSSLFDDAYTEVLRRYADLFRSFGYDLDYSFVDEPGINPVNRRVSNHLNRLAKRAGLTTWVTWYESCEYPLAGHDFVFNADSTQLPENKQPLPSWVLKDKDLRVLYTFDNATNSMVSDQSLNGNTGQLYAGAHLQSGAAVFNATTYMFTRHSDSMLLDSAGAVIMSIRLDKEIDEVAVIPARKFANISAANMAFYVYDWKADPWDEQSRAFYDFTLGGQSAYGMVQPSWSNYIYDTIVWEMHREGVEDSRIIRSLKNEIAKHPGLQASTEASKFLNDLFSKPSRSWPKYKREKATGVILILGVLTTLHML